MYEESFIVLMFQEKHSGAKRIHYHTVSLRKGLSGACAGRKMTKTIEVRTRHSSQGAYLIE